MDKTRAFDVLNRLAFERVSATPKELEAAYLIEEECKKMGVPVQIEPFDVPFPEVTEVKFEIVKPYHQEIYCTGHGGSGQTSDEGICGPLAYIHGGQDEYIQDVKGKIVLLTGRMSSDLRKKLVKKGALGYIITWGGLFDDEIMKTQIPHRHATVAKDDDSNFPGVMMHLSTAETLVKEKPEEVRIVLKQDMHALRQSRNVVATIEGTDIKDEWVIFSAHYDSVEFSNGAWDNATGSVTLLELCHYFVEHPPRRTVKFVWCGSEEIDLNGSYAFCEDHKDDIDKMIFNINFDMTGVLFGEDSVFGSVDKGIVDRCLYLAKVKGKYLSSRGIGMPSTDATSFVLHDIPAISFGSGGVRNGATIHSRRDTMDHLDADRFMELCKFAAVFSEEIINAAINVIPKELPKEVTDKKEYWKKDLGLI